MSFRAPLLTVILLAACAHHLPPEASASAVAALADARFPDAEREAQAVLAQDQLHSRAHVVLAMARYQQTMHQFITDLTSLPNVLFSSRAQLNHRYFRFSFEETSKALAAVEADLAVAADDPAFGLELCLACWKQDWNHNGHLDSNDQHLFEVEQDADGHEMAEDDPRRKPTFHFDRGDIYWARAAVAFQRATLELLLSYRWTDIDELFRQSHNGDEPTRIVIRMDDARRVAGVRGLILAGLEHADRARREYLQETDDDREWVPNPRQKSHPLPLPVDDTLYATWEGLVGDLRRLALGEEGLSVAEVAQLGDHVWEHPPGGFIDVGRMLAQPADLNIDLSTLDHLNREPLPALKSIFGAAYVPSMKPTPMLQRLSRMKRELDHGQESFERKLRYLLWLN